MNALASHIHAHAEVASQVELYALADQVAAMIAPGAVAYAAGSKAVTHRSGRRLYRAGAAETLAFHRQTIADANTGPQLLEATRRIASQLHRAIAITFPENN